MAYLYKTIIVWLRNDLRLSDNETLFRACQDAQFVLPVYCFDKRQFEKTQFGFDKTGNFRLQFLLQSLKDLQYRLREIGGDLLVYHGLPEDILYSLAKYYNAEAIYCQQEATAEEIEVEDLLISRLHIMDSECCFFWGHTLFHYDDLPFDGIDNMPDALAQFSDALRQQANPRPLMPALQMMTLPPNFLPQTTWPNVPQINPNNVYPPKPAYAPARAGFSFVGGETNGLLRLKRYLWEADETAEYTHAQHKLLSADASSRLSPWLALGALSPRFVYAETIRHQEEKGHNDKAQHLIAALLKRDFFRFYAMKHGNSLFKIGQQGQSNHYADRKPATDTLIFEKWATGNTGIPFVDANVRELNATGYISDEGRWAVAVFLLKYMGIDGQWGAEYFESMLLDYDVCSNYGNWKRVAEMCSNAAAAAADIDTDILVYARKYDPYGDYIKQWCPELKKLPSTRIHQPYLLSEAEQQYVGVIIGRHYPAPCVALQHKANEQ